MKRTYTHQNQSFDNVKMLEGKWWTLLVLYRAGLNNMHKAISANKAKSCFNLAFHSRPCYPNS